MPMQKHKTTTSITATCHTHSIDGALAKADSMSAFLNVFASIRHRSDQLPSFFSARAKHLKTDKQFSSPPLFLDSLSCILHKNLLKTAQRRSSKTFYTQPAMVYMYFVSVLCNCRTCWSLTFLFHLEMSRRGIYVSYLIFIRSSVIDLIYYLKRQKLTHEQRCWPWLYSFQLCNLNSVNIYSYGGFW